MFETVWPAYVSMVLFGAVYDTPVTGIVAAFVADSTMLLHGVSVAVTPDALYRPRACSLRPVWPNDRHRMGTFTSASYLAKVASSTSVITLCEPSYSLRFGVWNIHGSSSPCRRNPKK